MSWNWDWDWEWATAGITDEIPRTTGPECINYMTNRRRWIESILLCLLFIYIMYKSWQRLEPIQLPPKYEIDRPHSATRLFLIIIMTLVFGIELGFKLAGRSMLFALNPCHVQTCVQIYLLAAKPTKFTTSLFRIQLSNLNGPFLAFVFSEVDGRTYPFEQATYWIQHALLYIIPIYIIRSGAYTVEDLSDYKWVKIGTSFMLFYHFSLLNGLSILTGINVDHMLCAALSDPFQGENYRLAACLHEALLCPILNKGTVWLFRPKKYAYEHIPRSTIKNCYDACCDSFQTDATNDIYQQIKLHQNQHPDYATTAELAMNAVDSNSMRQRYTTNYDDPNGSGGGIVGAGGIDGDIITTEYTMPTTKID